MLVLGIETSCDETGIALYHSEQGLLSEALYSQVAIHADYGGVVPELASRDHILKLLPLIDEVLGDASVTPEDIEGIAYTSGPGLVGALMTGASVAQSLGIVWKVPAIGVHHMEGHMMAPMLEDNPPEFPFVALLVSGGHTQLVQVDGLGCYILLGDSVDDAAGEAFDKVAKMLGMDYPGGPRVAKLALQGDQTRFTFPRPMTDRPGLDFSFSGLKTFTMNTLKSISDDHTPTDQDKADVAAAFELAVVDTLSLKCRRALRQTGLKRLVIAGGVSANVSLRQTLTRMTAKEKAEVYYPRPEFCTDNGAMIAYVGCQRLMAGQQDDLSIAVKPRWPLDTLEKLV